MNETPTAEKDARCPDCSQSWDRSMGPGCKRPWHHASEWADMPGFITEAEALQNNAGRDCVRCDLDELRRTLGPWAIPMLPAIWVCQTVIGHTHAVLDHEFEAFDGATCRACTRLVLDEDGYGTDCGLPPGAHPRVLPPAGGER